MGEDVEMQKPNSAAEPAKTEEQPWPIAGMSITLISAVIVVVRMIVIGYVWNSNLNNMENALIGTSNQFRASLAQSAQSEIAALIRPCWTMARLNSERIKTSPRPGILPPTVETISDPVKYQMLLDDMHPSIIREMYSRTMTAEGRSTAQNHFVGTVFFIAVGEDGKSTTGKAMAECMPPGTPPPPGGYALKNSIFTSMVLAPPLEGETLLTAKGYASDRQYYKGGPGQFYNLSAITREIFLYFPEHKQSERLGPVVDTPPMQPACVLYGPILMPPMQQAFDNYTWFVLPNPGLGWGNHLEGNTPLYNEKGEIIGRQGSAISLGGGVSPLLERVIASGDKITANGHAILFTEEFLFAGKPTELVLGTTDNSTWYKNEKNPAARAPNFVADVLKVEDSITAKALKFVKEELGGNGCTNKQHFLQIGDSLLVDITPFRAEDYGMPPLNQVWCVMTIIPRQNIFKATDEAIESSSDVSLVAGIFGGFAIALLLISLLLAVKTKKGWKWGK